jgi:predicted site-specific integrase-resolvase
MPAAKQVVQSRYVTLREWAAMMFSKIPHENTLLRWVHDGRIQPQPKKIGKSWQVKRDAQYVAD